MPFPGENRGSTRHRLYFTEARTGVKMSLDKSDPFCRAARKAARAADDQQAAAMSRSKLGPRKIRPL